MKKTTAKQDKAAERGKEAGAGQFFAEERKSIILKKLEEDSKILVQDLSVLFDVSPATVRTDLRELEKTGQLLRTHGGAIPTGKAGLELNTAQKEVANKAEKKRIAREALKHVEDGDSIAIDTGTTTYEFAATLSERKNLTIVTNDISIAALLEENTDHGIILIGGALRRGFHCTVGAKAIESLADINVDKAFLAANAFTFERGFSTPSIEHAEIKKRFREMSLQSFMLMDSHKIGHIAFYTFAMPEDIDVFITDSNISGKVASAIAASADGLELVKV
ncbi:MAG: DeoR/GlpR family DNA-binding transcription regulator [Clostridiales Family XIII bacterium]|jgi:DeoR family fructose operon transcriptional repressor|nr:DeoR/GlpR family DNA-binding transcription regulator [Clostridiales Family XIII bacterium]